MENGDHAKLKLRTFRRSKPYNSNQVSHILISDTNLLSVYNKRPLSFVFNPFTPKSDQCQISPAASPEILHHTVGIENLAFHSVKDDYTTNSRCLT